MCQYRIKTNPFCWQPHYIYTIPVESHESIVPPTATRLMQPAQSETRSEKIAPGGRAINHQRQTPAANSPIPMHARQLHCNTLRLACVAACADNLPRDASPASPGMQQLKSTATFCAVLHSTESLDASKRSALHASSALSLSLTSRRQDDASPRFTIARAILRWKLLQKHHMVTFLRRIARASL
jgi:hypothetical protein